MNAQSHLLSLPTKMPAVLDLGAEATPDSEKGLSDLAGVVVGDRIQQQRLRASSEVQHEVNASSTSVVRTVPWRQG